MRLRTASASDLDFSKAMAALAFDLPIARAATAFELAQPLAPGPPPLSRSVGGLSLDLLDGQFLAQLIERALERAVMSSPFL